MTSDPVLVLLTDPKGAAGLLDAAEAAARALGTKRIDALHVRLDPISTILPSEEILTPEQVRAIEGAAAAQGAKLQAAFDAWRAAGHVARRTAHWDEVAGVPAEEINRRGTAAALVAMTLPAPHPVSAEWAALEAALFGTGRPVLVVPLNWNGGFGRHLAVGWRDSPATHHALDALRPWLDAAETVTVITVGDAPPPADGPLALAPGRVTHRKLDRADGGDGAALLAAAVEAGADGLAMGAYRRGRVLEWMLGGVTEYVLHHTKLPLLLRH